MSTNSNIRIIRIDNIPFTEEDKKSFVESVIWFNQRREIQPLIDAALEKKMVEVRKIVERYEKLKNKG